MKDFILDIGSRTIKLHGLDPSTGRVSNLQNFTWDILSGPLSDEVVYLSLQASLAALPRPAPRIKAIGTEAMRRSPDLAQMVEKACSELRIDYSTISQELEANLISLAAQRHGISSELDVVNAGGGSIQVVSQTSGQIQLMRFGISDLNRDFKLNGPSHARRIDSCIEWLGTQTPHRIKEFAYTGGERTYLGYFGVPVGADGRCQRSDFEAFAYELSKRPIYWLRKNSPFDSQWMTGAVASNCIVLAFMRSARADWFLPSDVNIGHGMLASVFEHFPISPATTVRG